MTTLKISIYAGILIALPVLLYQVYAFLLPALKPTERRVVMPFLILIPLLFIAGVVFSYFVVVPAATQVPAQLQPERVQHPGPGQRATTASSSSPWSRSGSSSRCPMGILALTRLGIIDARAALPQPPLRVPDPGGRRDAPPGNRPGHDADRAGAAPGAVRVLADPGAAGGHAPEPTGGAAVRGAGARAAGEPRTARLRAVLFDLRGKRRRLVQVVYSLLAAIFLIGFVFLGIGVGSALGSIFDLFGLAETAAAARRARSSTPDRQRQASSWPEEPEGHRCAREAGARTSTSRPRRG